MFDLNFLKNAIRSEGGFELSENILDSFLSKGKMFQLGHKEYFI